MSFEGALKVDDYRHLDSDAARWWHGPRTKTRQVEVRDGKLFIDDVAVDPDHYSHGYVQPVIGIDDTKVLLLDAAHGKRLEITTPSEDDAKRLIAALHLTGDRQLTRFMSSQIVMLGLVLGFATIAASMVGAAWFTKTWLLFPVAMVLGACAVFAARYARFPVSVGPDGILVEKRGRPARFIPWSEIARAEDELRGGVVLTLDTGEEVRFELETDDDYRHYDPGFGAKPGGPKGVRQRDALLGRIRDAMAEVRSDALAAELAIAGRSAAAWLQHLRNTLSGSHRTAAPNDDQLWRIVENGHADPSARAAAAHLLRERLDREGKGRLRVAAVAAAEPRLRICLEEVADAEEEQAAQQALASFAHAERQ